MEERELLLERLELALDRIREIPGEDWQEESLQHWKEYFTAVAKFLLLIEDTRQFLEQGKQNTATLEELKQRNHALYEDILPENYENSFANPAVAVKCLGEEFGALAAFLYTEMRSLIGFTYEGRLDELVIRMELFSEVYAAFVYEEQENHRLPSYASIREILYWFVSDYADVAAEARVRELVCPGNNFAADIIRRAELTDLRYLYAYGEYVGENELSMAKFLNSLPEETINTMADTYTEGYRIGFEVTGKDLSKKAAVDVRYQLGFERMCGELWRILTKWDCACDLPCSCQYFYIIPPFIKTASTVSAPTDSMSSITRMTRHCSWIKCIAAGNWKSCIPLLKNIRQRPEAMRARPWWRPSVRKISHR